jgi:HK97 family phage major capsid protein
MNDFDKEFIKTDEFQLSPKDRAKYSVRKFLSSLVLGNGLDGLEKEVADEAKKIRSAHYALEGKFLPLEALAPKMTRDLTVGNFGQGGAFVGTEIGDPIPLLTNKLATTRLGARLMTGLTGGFNFPRITSGATVQSLAETAEAQTSQPTIDQVGLTPHRVSVTCKFSKQLLLQSSVQIEAWLRAHLLQMVAVKYDFLLLNGSGSASEPTGILNTPGVGSILFGGAASYQKLVDMQTALGNYNAELSDSRFGYLTSPTVRGKLKGTAVALSGASTISARPVWDDGNFSDDSSDGKIAGTRAAATNQIQNNLVIFGDWTKAILCVYGSGLDVVIDVFSMATSAEVKITLNSFIDIAILHPQSFVVSGDSAAQ